MSERLLSDEALEHEYGAHTHLDSLRAIAAAQHAHTIAKLAATCGVDVEALAHMTVTSAGVALTPAEECDIVADAIRLAIATALASRDAELAALRPVVAAAQAWRDAQHLEDDAEGTALMLAVDARREPSDGK